MLEIIINGITYHIGQPLPLEVTSATITYNPIIRIQFPKEQESAIKEWLLQLIANCTCEYIVLNNTFYRVDELPYIPTV